MMPQLSFRKLLIIGFMVFTIALSSITLQAVYSIVHLIERDQESVQTAVLLTEETQRLAEQTIVMERSARQYMVLQDATFLAIFSEAALKAKSSLQKIDKANAGVTGQLTSDWAAQSEAVSTMLQQKNLHRPRNRTQNQNNLINTFKRLNQINEKLNLTSKREIDRSHTQMLIELEKQQNIVLSVIVLAMLFAILLAMLFGIWLTRPLVQIEKIIDRLGDNKLDKKILVTGPADIRKLGQQLEWLRIRLNTLADDRNRFLRHISHELKTPLAALREGVALMHEEVAGKLNVQQHEIVQILDKNTQSLQTQIEDLLHYNSVAFNAQQLQLTKLNLNHLLENAVEEQRLQWQARQLQIQIVSSEVYEINADAEKLRIVFANLLANAIRFSPPHGLILFEISRDAAHILVDCIDQGAGVAPQDAAHIFEPFYQGQRQPLGARNNNGIGLSIVREYMLAHNGEIQLIPSKVGAHFQIGFDYEH